MRMENPRPTTTKGFCRGSGPCQTGHGWEVGVGQWERTILDGLLLALKEIIRSNLTPHASRTLALLVQQPHYYCAYNGTRATSTIQILVRVRVRAPPIDMGNRSGPCFSYPYCFFYSDSRTRTHNSCV